MNMNGKTTPAAAATSVVLLATSAVLLAASPAAFAAGPMDFDPINGTPYGAANISWQEPLVVPEGFCQTKVFDETDLDMYPGQNDLNDMNTVNETGPQAGRYLYSTKEVGSDGGLSVVDLKTGEVSEMIRGDDWSRLDGIRWTPWGTLLFAEETSGGRLFEAYLDPKDLTTVTKVEERREVGIMRHEGIEATEDGTVYVIDELNGGSIYKFEPTKRGDLSEGQLYALKLDGLSDAEQKWNSDTFTDKVGSFAWVPLDMDQVVVDADTASNEVNATEFGRPEDVEVIGKTLYVNNTSEDRTVAIDLNEKRLSSYVLAGENVPAENRESGMTGFNNPDNLAQGPDGTLWIAEDNFMSDIWVAEKDKNHDGQADDVKQFASLVDSGAEISGIYFGKDPKTLFLSIQHPDKPLADGVWKVTPC